MSQGDELTGLAAALKQQPVGQKQNLRGARNLRSRSAENRKSTTLMVTIQRSRAHGWIVTRNGQQRDFPNLWLALDWLENTR
jgi:hypothetical protein